MPSCQSPLFALRFPWAYPFFSFILRLCHDLPLFCFLLDHQKSYWLSIIRHRINTPKLYEFSSYFFSNIFFIIHTYLFSYLLSVFFPPCYTKILSSKIHLYRQQFIYIIFVYITSTSFLLPTYIFPFFVFVIYPSP